MNNVLVEYFEEYVLSRYEIHQYCKQLGYSYKIYQNNKVAIIETGLDSWKLIAKQFVNNDKLVNRIEVKHCNRGGNKKGKMQYHFQAYADTIGYVFMGIIKTYDHENNIIEDIFMLKDVFDELALLKHA